MVRQTTYEGLMARYAAGYGRVQPIYGEQVAATTSATLGTVTQINWQRAGITRAMPSSLPSGVSGFIPTKVTFSSSPNLLGVWLVKLIDLGSLNISTNVFTDGNSMPTVTEMNTSRVQSGAVIMEVTTALNATPGSITITYTDQDGNSGQTSTSQALGASAVVGSIGNLQLASGDYAIRDISSAARTGGTTPTGVVKFWGIVPITMAYSVAVGNGETVDLLTTSFAPQLLGTNDQMYVLVGTTTAANDVTQGIIHLVGDS